MSGCSTPAPRQLVSRFRVCYPRRPPSPRQAPAVTSRLRGPVPVRKFANHSASAASRH